MNRIQHIAFSTHDPVETAEFYKRNFGLTELRRKPADTGADSVYLTDGYFYITIKKFRPGDGAALGGQHALPGVDHIGFRTDDLEASVRTIEASGATKAPGESNPINPAYLGPDGVMIDIRRGGWDGHIRFKTQLYQLVPETRAEASKSAVAEGGGGGGD